jgi:hypothetical protein
LQKSVHFENKILLFDESKVYPNALTSNRSLKDTKRENSYILLETVMVSMALVEILCQETFIKGFFYKSRCQKNMRTERKNIH